MHGDLTGVRLSDLSLEGFSIFFFHKYSSIYVCVCQPNILVDNEGHACLCDFGLSRTVVGFQGTQFFTSNMGGALRWMDIALLRYDEDSKEEPTGLSMETDVYSLGCIMLQVCSLVLLSIIS